MKPSFSIIGCGKLANALGRQLVRAGYPPAGFASRTPSSARNLAQICGNAHTGGVMEIAGKGDLVFITTPDGVISGVCEEIARENGFRKGSFVIHCSGAHPSTLLESAVSCGAKIASMHPLQSFAADTGDKNPFAGIVVSVEGDAEAVNAAENISKDLGAHCIRLRTEGKVFYHAAAVVASNYLVTLLRLSFRMMEKAGIPEDEVFGVLKPLITGTLANIEKNGISGALTGPIVRGDLETVARHLSAMEKDAPEMKELYRILGLDTVDIAEKSGALKGIALQEMKRILLSE